MNRRGITIAGILALLLFSAGWYGGRMTAPVPEQAIAKAAIKYQLIEAKQTAAISDKQAEKAEAVHDVIVKYYRRPPATPGEPKTPAADCPIASIETRDTGTIERQDNRRATETSQTIQAQGSAVTETVTRLTLPPRWQFSGFAGLHAVRPSPDTYGGSLVRHVIGPLYLGAWAVAGGARAAGISVTLVKS